MQRRGTTVDDGLVRSMNALLVHSFPNVNLGRLKCLQNARAFSKAAKPETRILQESDWHKVSGLTPEEYGSMGTLTNKCNCPPLDS